LTDIIDNNDQAKKSYGFWYEARNICRLYNDDSTKLFFRLNPGDSLQEIVEVFIDSDDQFYVGYKPHDRSGFFLQYAVIGKLLKREEKEESI
jgi:hypothetical protein